MSNLEPTREGSIPMSMDRLRETVDFLESVAQELVTRTATIRRLPIPDPDAKKEAAEDPIASSCDLACGICECAGKLSNILRTLNRLMEELEL